MYAIEVTETAKRALAMVKANGVEDVVEVLQQRVEDVRLPEGEHSVDIIVSEWMGYFLLRGMLDSVVLARDRWLKPGGAMYPSHARIMPRCAAAAVCRCAARAGDV